MTGNAKQKVNLWLVATPIGNLDDMSPRAVQVLSEADFVAAEDTRNSGVLLRKFDIKKPMISYYEHNTSQRGEEILARLAQGEVCALVSDAGMPAISDPGEVIVRQCIDAGYKVSAVPGPCALVCALAISGLSTRRFAFEGFLSAVKGERRDQLKALENDTHTLVFYEAPHKLKRTLEDMLSHFGDRKVSLVREISKIYEEVLTGKFSEALEYYKKNEPIGEFVIVVEGAPLQVQDVPGTDALRAEYEALISSGEKASAAAKIIAARYSLSKRDVYASFAINDQNSGKV